MRVVVICDEENMGEQAQFLIMWACRLFVLWWGICRLVALRALLALPLSDGVCVWFGGLVPLTPSPY